MGETLFLIVFMLIVVGGPLRLVLFIGKRIEESGIWLDSDPFSERDVEEVMRDR